MRNKNFEKNVLSAKYPIPTPNRCRVAVPEANPNAKRIGLEAQGISKPWAVPWQNPNIPTKIIVNKTESFFSMAIAKPKRITDKIMEELWKNNENLVD